MQESYGKGPASHPDPESCAGGRDAAGEAFDRGTRRPAIELRNLPFGVPTPLCEAEGHTADGTIGEPSEDPAQSEILCMRGNPLRGKRDVPRVPVVDGTAGRPEKVTSRNPGMHARGHRPKSHGADLTLLTSSRDGHFFGFGHGLRFVKGCTHLGFQQSAEVVASQFQA
jgi:hypothetical protein